MKLEILGFDWYLIRKCLACLGKHNENTTNLLEIKSLTLELFLFGRSVMSHSATLEDWSQKWKFMMVWLILQIISDPPYPMSTMVEPRTYTWFYTLVYCVIHVFPPWIISSLMEGNLSVRLIAIFLQSNSMPSTSKTHSKCRRMKEGRDLIQYLAMKPAL